VSAPLDQREVPAGGTALWLRAGDGVRLRFAQWPGPKGMVLILPGRTEYIEKYGPVIATLAARGWGAGVIDWRGQGLSDRLAADPRLGHVGRFSDYQLDLHAALEAAHAPGPMPWLCHSMGGCIGLRGVMRGLKAPALAFSAPMWGLPLGGHLRAMIRTLASLGRPIGRDHAYLPTTGPDFGLPSMAYEGNILSGDPQMFARMKRQITEDPRLALGGPSLRWGAEALREMASLALMPAPAIPALIGVAGGDKIVANTPIRARAALWPGAQAAEYPKAQHEILMERPEIRDDFLTRALDLFERTFDRAGG